MSQQQQPHCFRSLSFSLRNHLNHHHHSLTLALVVVVALVTLITFSSHPCVHSLSSPSPSPSSTPPIQPIPQITNSLNTPSSNQDRYSQNAMAICRLRGTRHLPSLHGTLYFSLPPSSSRDNSPIMTETRTKSGNDDTENILLYINGSIIGFNTLEFSKRSLPFHIHEFGNVLENDGMSVGGHLLDQQQDIGATISPLSIQDSLKVNNILNFQHYSHASSLLSLENVIGRSMIVHHFENNGTRRIGQCVIAVMPSLTRMSSTSTSSSSSSINSASTSSNSGINSSASTSSNGINSVGENLSNSIKSIITSSIDFSKMKYKLVAHLRGTNRMSQPVNGTVIITEEDESKKMTIYLKMCHLMNSISGWNQLDSEEEHLVMSIHEGGDISNLGISLIEMDYTRNDDERRQDYQQYTFSQIYSLKHFAGRAFSISHKLSKQLLAWGTLGVAQSHLNPLLTLEQRTCHSNEIKQDLTSTVQPTVKSRFYSKIRIENQDANTGKIHEFSGFLLFDYLKRKVYAKAQNSGYSNRTYELVVIPNYFTKFLSVYLLVDSKCLFLSSQLHLTQIPLELKLQQVTNHPIYQIIFKGFTVVNSVHCEEWYIKTRELFGREFETEISLFTSRNNYQLVKAIISKTPIGPVSIELSQVSELEYPFDDQLEEWSQQASVKCRYGNIMMLQQQNK